MKKPFTTRKKNRKATPASLMAIVATTLSPMVAAELTIASNDIQAGKLMPVTQEFKGFGCNGLNQSPHLSWRGAPEGTKSYAITAYDPDAPTGSGWWHWLVVNIPVATTYLQSDAGNVQNGLLPKGSQTFRSDYGTKDFGGACPPEGDKAHRYQFKVFALNIESLELPTDASAALVGFYLNAHALETATLEALYKR